MSKAKARALAAPAAKPERPIFDTLAGMFQTSPAQRPFCAPEFEGPPAGYRNPRLPSRTFRMTPRIVWRINQASGSYPSLSRAIRVAFRSSKMSWVAELTAPATAFPAAVASVKIPFGHKVGLPVPKSMASSIF